jgi:hypothetical protein
MAKNKHLGGLMKFLSDHHLMTYANKDGSVGTVDLRSDKTTDDALRLLGELPSLKSIWLQGTQITDKGLANLSKLDQLEELDLRSCKGITDNGMEHVSNLGKLKRLQLYDTRVGNYGLGLLTRLKNLENLDLHSTQVTDSGLTQLEKLARLRTLQIGGKGPTDSGLEPVGRLEQLRWLLLGESSFTDGGLSYLGKLTRLTDLQIAWTEMTGAGFKHLGNLTRLKDLHASKTRFSDEGLKYLVPLKSLKHLALNGTAVTDTGLQYLVSLEKLKVLGLQNTRVSKQGKAMLKQALPRCVIHISADAGEIKPDQYDEDYFWSHPPRCIAGFNLKAIRDDVPTTYQLACTCGRDIGTVLGFPLSKYNHDYSGREFVGPLAFRCAQCGKTTEIIDTDQHGYDGECGSSVTIRGKGKRTDFSCGKCGLSKMIVIVHFEYGGGELDLRKEDPSIAVEDFFGSFSARVICLQCQDHVSVAGFECA